MEGGREGGKGVMEGGWRGDGGGMEGKGVMQGGGRGGSDGGGKQGNGGMEGRGHHWWALVIGGWGVIVSMGARYSSVGDCRCLWVGASPLSLGVIVLVVIGGEGDCYPWALPLAWAGSCLWVLGVTCGG